MAIFIAMAVVIAIMGINVNSASDTESSSAGNACVMERHAQGESKKQISGFSSGFGNAKLCDKIYRYDIIIA